jgi:hypothetical protein
VFTGTLVIRSIKIERVATRYISVIRVTRDIRRGGGGRIRDSNIRVIRLL